MDRMDSEGGAGAGFGASGFGPFGSRNMTAAELQELVSQMFAANQGFGMAGGGGFWSSQGMGQMGNMFVESSMRLTFMVS